MKLFECAHIIVTISAVLVAIWAVIVVYLEIDIQYINHGRFKWICHDLLKWHMPDSEIDTCDNEEHIQTSVCKYCKRPIISIDGGEWKTLDHFDNYKGGNKL